MDGLGEKCTPSLGHTFKLAVFSSATVPESVKMFGTQYTLRKGTQAVTGAVPL